MTLLVIWRAHSGKLCFLTGLFVDVFIIGSEKITSLTFDLWRYFDIPLRIDLLKLIARFLNKCELIIGRCFRPCLWNHYSLSLLVKMTLLICCGLRNVRRLLSMRLVLITVSIVFDIIDLQCHHIFIVLKHLILGLSQKILYVRIC